MLGAGICKSTHLSLPFPYGVTVRSDKEESIGGLINRLFLPSFLSCGPAKFANNK